MISGFPYQTKSKKINQDLEKIRNRFGSNGVKFTVLLLDNSHGTNQGLIQQIETKFLKRFYKSFIDWLLMDEEVGLIIKTKKPHVLNSLKQNSNFLDIAYNTKRCYVVERPFQEISLNYAKISNISVAIGTSMASALLECVSTGAKGIFYDYPNLRSLEKDIYSWGENKVFFQNLDNMINIIKSFKKDPIKNNFVGNWSSYLPLIDPFRDGRGGERIGNYMYWLKKELSKGLDKKESIKKANQKYAENWGKDKIYSF